MADADLAAADTETAAPAGPLVPEQAELAIREGSVQLVDVRAEDEHEAGHIAGDRLIPFDRLKDQAEALDRDKPVLLYCRSGDRSGTAAEALRASGWDANSIEGGLLDWVDRGLPIEPADGRVIEKSALPPD
jgi:rhodanese-related sulfurtransferase